MSDLKLALEKYGEWVLAKQLGRDSPKVDVVSFTENDNVKRARGMVKDCSMELDYLPKSGKLKTIFSFIRIQNNGNCHESEFPRKQLDIKLDSGKSDDDDHIWNGFYEEFQRLPQGTGRFETFFSLYRKYTWYIPGSLRMDGISLFEQFKAVTAISHCLEKGTEKLLLVGGDLPGIQSMLYTITSKGAAKSLRGRSFYLQMLCDILVQAIIRELSLPSANIIYSAGGNFKILASTQDEETLQILRREINSRLLDAHRGELFAAIDWVILDINDVVKSDEFSGKMDELAKKVTEQKRQWFAEHAKCGRYDDVFEVQGEGGPTSGSDELEPKNFCEVCHVEVDKDSRDFDPDEGTTKCYQCKSFEELSPTLDRNLFVVDSLEKSLVEIPRVDEKYWIKPFGKPSWTKTMQSFGFECAFENNEPKPNNQNANIKRAIYRLNDCSFLPDNIHPDCEYGFRFIGNTTPFMDEADAHHMDKHYKEKTQPGEIKNTTVMADIHSTGINRYGILRMDVDWLGSVFSERLTKRDLLHTSALSASLSLFFNGWLNCICKSIDRYWREKATEAVGSKDELSKSKLPYIIYSGGDDLFIVGSWDIMPILAERIRNDFANYVTNGYVSNERIENPCMTISAGISIFTAKFPIYQAAELAKEALDDKAKDRKIRQEGEDKEVKDAINFLDVTVGWEDFEAVKNMAFELSEMITKSNGDKIHRSFLTLLKHVADLYDEAAKSSDSDEVVYGKWMWQLAYSLCRLEERTKSCKLKEQIMKIGGSVYDLGTVKGTTNWKMIKYLKLPVRWAEFLTRGGE